MIFRFHTMRAICSIAAAQNFERSYKYGSKVAKCQGVEKSGAEVAVRCVTWPFILLPAVRQVHNLCQSQFSTECDLVFPLSIPSIISLTWRHPVAAHLFFPSLLSCSLSSLRSPFDYTYQYWSMAVWNAKIYNYFGRLSAPHVPAIFLTNVGTLAGLCRLHLQDSL